MKEALLDSAAKVGAEDDFPGKGLGARERVHVEKKSVFDAAELDSLATGGGDGLEICFNLVTGKMKTKRPRSFSAGIALGAGDVFYSLERPPGEKVADAKDAKDTKDTKNANSKKKTTPALPFSSSTHPRPCPTTGSSASTRSRCTRGSGPIR